MAMAMSMSKEVNEQAREEGRRWERRDGVFFVPSQWVAIAAPFIRCRCLLASLRFAARPMLCEMGVTLGKG
jgi:hypothetical protein